MTSYADPKPRPSAWAAHCRAFGPGNPGLPDGQTEGPLRNPSGRDARVPSGWFQISGAPAGGPAEQPLLRGLLGGVLEDEARHSAFGNLALKQLCIDLKGPERREREDFIFDACRILAGEIETRPIWESVGLDPEECMAIEYQSPGMQEYRRLLFSKVLPSLRSLGLLSERLRKRLESLGLSADRW